MTTDVATIPGAPLQRLLDGRPAWARLPAVAAGVGLMALASQVAIPLGPVPLTLQTLALFLIAGLGGLRLTFEIVIVWLLCAILGLPVLADGASGPEALSGPTGGYLVAMLFAAPLTGRTAERSTDFVRLALAFLLGHVLILVAGWAWLALHIGVGDGFMKGVAPFLVGAVLKSLLAAGVVQLVRARVKVRSS